MRIQAVIGSGGSETFAASAAGSRPELYFFLGARPYFRRRHKAKFESLPPIRIHY